MKFILNGGGTGEKCRKSYQKFAELVNGQKVLFIPFANDEQSPEEALEWFKAEVEPFGITNIEMAKSPQELSISRLKSVGGVYFCGGNTFLLLATLKKCKAFKVVKEYCKHDGVIMGGSAGTTIFGKSIDSCLKDDLKIIASDENIVGLKDTRGFNVAGGYSFFVHYRVKERQYEATEMRVQRLLADGHNLICLPEETSLFIQNGRMSIIGDRPAEVVTPNGRITMHPEKDNSADDCQEL